VHVRCTYVSYRTGLGDRAMSKQRVEIQTLVNKKSGRKSSSTDLLTDLAAINLAEGGMRIGIASLLNYAKAERLLKHNRLKKVKLQATPEDREPVKNEIKVIAQNLMPELLKAFAESNVRSQYLSQNKRRVSRWLAKQSGEPNSSLNKLLRTHPEGHHIHQLKRSVRWWFDRISSSQ
jgi:hypothetical protein